MDIGRQFHALTLRKQIALLIAAISILITVVSYFTITYFSTRIEESRLEGVLTSQVQLRYTFISQDIQHYKEDIRFITHLPQINEYLLAKINNTDTNKVGGLERALRQTFAAYVNKNPHAMQLRLLAVSEPLGQPGAELVRVDRHADKIEIIPGRKLQNKVHRNYFIVGQSLAEGAIYLSDVNLNRENKRIEIPHRPTLRVITPLYNESVMLGMLILNIDVTKLLAKISIKVDELYKQHVYLLNQHGDYLVHPDKSQTFGFEYNRVRRWQNDFTYVNHGRYGLKYNMYRRGNEAYYVEKKRYIFDEDNNRYIDIIVTVSADTLSLGIAAQRKNLLVGLILGIIVLTIFISLYIKRVMKPLSALTVAAEQFGHGDIPDNLPYNTSAELDVLINTFKKMTENILQREQEILILNKTLKKKEIQATNIFEAAPEAMVVADTDGVMVKANRFFEDTFGYTRNELIGHKVEMLLPRRSREHHIELRTNYDFMSRVLGQDRDLVAQRKNGEEFNIILCLSAVEFEDNRYIIAGVRDIHERVEAEKQAARYLQQLEISNEELDNFAYVASHDLKVPLRGIKQLAAWLDEELSGVDNGEVQRYLVLMQNRIVRLEKLLDDLLDYSKINRLDLPLETINLQKLVEDNFTLLSAPPEFKLVLTGKFETIRTVVTPLEQVIRNLLSNALKHHDRSAGSIEVSLNIEADGYWFAISDDGPGIPEKHHERIFKMFQTLRARDEVEGSGMGLALVKKIIDTYGGTIQVISQSDKRGTCFRFFWPRKIKNTQRIAS